MLRGQRFYMKVETLGTLSSNGQAARSSRRARAVKDPRLRRQRIFSDDIWRTDELA
jgi:hypothetical protein